MTKRPKATLGGQHRKDKIGGDVPAFAGPPGVERHGEEHQDDDAGRHDRGSSSDPIARIGVRPIAPSQVVPGLVTD